MENGQGDGLEGHSDSDNPMRENFKLIVFYLPEKLLIKV